MVSDITPMNFLLREYNSVQTFHLTPLQSLMPIKQIKFPGNGNEEITALHHFNVICAPPCIVSNERILEGNLRNTVKFRFILPRRQCRCLVRASISMTFKPAGGYGYLEKKYTIILPYKIVLHSLYFVILFP